MKRVVPGTIISNEPTSIAGNGAYKSTYIRSSLVGRVEEDGLRINVVAENIKPVVAIGSIILGKVFKITTKNILVDIYIVGDLGLDVPFPGIINLKDIKKNSSNLRVKDCFRPGDIIRAKVYGRGEEQSFLLSTVESDLGVIVAYSTLFHPLLPISCDSMICSKTKQLELRKCAI